MAEPNKRFREVPLSPPPAADKKAAGQKPDQGTAKSPKDGAPPAPPAQKDETGGPTGLEPTRYGDWERGGRCTDF